MATRGSTQREGAKSDGASLERLGGSLDAAQDAPKDLRRELSKGGRDLLKDLDVLQKAAAGKRPAAAKRAPAKHTRTTKRTGAASWRKPSALASASASNF